MTIALEERDREGNFAFVLQATFIKRKNKPFKTTINQSGE